MYSMKKTTALTLVLLLSVVTQQTLVARFLGFGSEGDDAFVHVGGEQGIGVGSVGVGGDRGVVHVGSNAYEEGRKDAANNKGFNTGRYWRGSKKDAYQQGYDDMMAEMGDAQPQRSNRRQSRRQARRQSSSSSRSDLYQHGPMYNESQNVEAMR